MNQLENILSQSLSLFIIVPLIAFLTTTLLENKRERIIGGTVRVAKVLYIILAVLFAVGWMMNGFTPISYKLATLYQTEHFVFAIQFYYDEVTAVFSIVGSLLFFLVATFSKYYMHRDEGFKRFFNIILLFAAGYNFIIFSGNFETLFVGWEIKGLCSFLLIAFYRNRYLPVKNAFKTISNYRVSDVALILAMWMMHHLTHQNISYIQLDEARNIAAQTDHAGMAMFIVCMFILAATVKSAQFPFTTWLPRAMEGPTSSSAIFYGSLSVHIGVFFLLRTHAFWQDMLWAKIAIIIIGALTGIFATLIARVQPNVKTQIAYSSAAQIGIMFIEIALGFHWLVLIHFAGNAFLRTYQLLVSPSVLNYLVHHQYFHYHPPQNKVVGKLKAALYILAVKEWNLDTFMFKYVWSPFKWIGRQLQAFQSSSAAILFLVVGFAAVFFSHSRIDFFNENSYVLAVCLLGIALLLLLFAFSSRGSALNAWVYVLMGQIFIFSGALMNAGDVHPGEVIYYASGILISFLLGLYCLFKTKAVDHDITLNKYHGYVYEDKVTAVLFLLAAIGLLGFPVTAAFIGIDVFFTYVESGQAVLITLLGLCFIFVELAAIRIFLRIYMGPHKKLYHPVAFRSS
ncbi:MAG TPA: proton-conducting transporter membrane subunit [Chitinophagaceae bacterium]|nr:proton-conducting transporter membrane subunit [Chitinophagaceae bacterium]